MPATVAQGNEALCGTTWESGSELQRLFFRARFESVAEKTGVIHADHPCHDPDFRYLRISCRTS